MRHTAIVFLCIGSALLCCRHNSKGCLNPSDSNTPIHEPVDSIVVIKGLRLMRVYHHQKLLKEYHVCLGPNPRGPKHFRNDGKTPEGIYQVNGKNPNSHYHKALAVSYPSVKDITYAGRFGKPTGGDIKIHGLPNDYQGADDDTVTTDWTLGCIALNNKAIDELFAHTDLGVWVNILP